VNTENTQANLPAKQETVGALLVQAAQELDSGGLGKLLKFTKGKYFVGDDEVSIGREMIAHVTAVARGWVKFADGKMVAQHVGKVADGFVVPKREDLGDTDNGKWERDPGGLLRDPWSFQWYLPLEDAETGEVVVFVTASHGGRSAVGSLCRIVGRNVRKGTPIIRLNVSSYRHKTYGRIETPDFPIVGWAGVPATEVIAPGAAKELDDEIPF
jgi:hypothetical protein